MRLPLFLLVLACIPYTHAFELSGNFWESGQASFHVGIDGNAPSGSSWNEAFKRAMQAWTDQTAFQFIAVDEYVNPCILRADNGFGDDVVGVDFTFSVCGDAYGANTLAVTLTVGTCFDFSCNTGFSITDADIVFKEDESWDIYSGDLRAATDFERVALHELGHALGLNHSFANQAIMAPLVSDLHTLQTDDINAANTIYGSGATIQSIYGIDISLPSSDVFRGPNNSLTLDGRLTTDDAILEGSFLDLYQLHFENDSSINLQMQSQEIDPLLYLVRVDLAQAPISGFTFIDDNSGSGSAAFINTEIPAGTYWVGATSAANSAQGNYEITMTSFDVTPFSTNETVTSKYGADYQVNRNPRVTGTLANSDFDFNGKFLDIYQIEIAAETRLRFNLNSGDFDTTLILVEIVGNEDIGSLVVENDDISFSNRNSEIEQTLPAGTYWLGVSSFFGQATGNYELTSTVVIP